MWFFCVAVKEPLRRVLLRSCAWRWESRSNAPFRPSSMPVESNGYWGSIPMNDSLSPGTEEMAHTSLEISFVKCFKDCFTLCGGWYIYIYILHLYISEMSETATSTFVLRAHWLTWPQNTYEFSCQTLGFSKRFSSSNVAMTALYVSWPAMACPYCVHHGVS